MSEDTPKILIPYEDAPFGFPGNIVWMLAAGASRVPEVDVVLRRALRVTDPHRSVGVIAMDWNPEQYEIGTGAMEPTLACYNFRVQYMVKMAGDEALAMQQHASGSKSVRTMLYRDAEFNVQLRSLSETDYGRTEQVKKFTIKGQRYLSNEISGTFIHISSIDLSVDVEIT